MLYYVILQIIIHCQTAREIVMRKIKHNIKLAAKIHAYAALN